MSLTEVLLDDVRALMRVSPVALDTLSGALDLGWSEVDGGIEAERGEQRIRITREEICITHCKFAGQTVIPLR